MTSNPRPPGAASADAFTLLHDKNMLAPASASSWCPTMDLLALATSDGQLSLARLDWNKPPSERENKLWTSNPDSPVTSLGWRPDGKVLVSGHADGTVQLLHVEDGEVLHVSRPHDAAVTCVHWQEAPASDAFRSSCAHQTAAARFTLPGRHRDSRERDRDRRSSRFSRDDDPDRALLDHFNPTSRLTVLCTGDARGVIALSAFGVFSLARANLSASDVRAGDGAAFPPETRFVARHVSASPNLSRVLVAFEVRRPAARATSTVHDDDDDDENDGSSSALYVTTADASLLGARARDLCEIASQGWRATRAAEDADATLAAAAETWRKARVDFLEKMRTLQRRLREWDGGGDADVLGVSTEDHFLALLASGAANDVLEEFLSHEFRGSAVRRAAKSVDAAATAVHAALVDRVVPATESALLRLAELRATSRWRERVAAVGLDEKRATAAEAAAERACLAASTATRVATDAAARLRAFFVLLLRTQRALAGENPDGGAEEQNALPAANDALARAFLADGVAADPLGEELSAANVTMTEENAPEEDEDEDEDEVEDENAPREETPRPKISYASRAAFLAAVRGAAAAAGFADEDARRDEKQTALPPLWRAVAELRGACAATLDGPSRAISASLRWSPAFAVVSSGVDGGGARASPRVSHGGWTEDGARETLCFHAGAADAGERHAVGILEIRRGAPEAALAIAAPAGMEVVDAAPYTDGRVLVLLQPSSATRGAEEGEGDVPAAVVMVDPAALPGARGFVAFAAEAAFAAPVPPPGCVPAEGAAEMRERGEGAAAGGARYRALPGLVATAPLAVGRSKGLAAVLVGSRRIVLLDLEEDEGDEDDSEDED